ncbi:MAG: hypothetical protein ABT15_01400 [Pseudonocardia sp. SCN 73-27]|nr:MAG: hypothetical protein ABS80_04010 [Pseudonocardia sp. SCN 72-51]ODV08924.1 MAG: hypothetical protein ABT15_01400 [Pseudonocardia sp. SCN 73-27]
MDTIRRRVGCVAGGAVIAAGLLLPGAGIAAAADGTCATAGTTTTCTFGYTGTEQTFTVPPGITSVQVTAVGAGGGQSINGNSPSRGARVVGALTGLTANQVLYVEVGGTAHGDPTGKDCEPTDQCKGGFNGGGSATFGFGGGGGGASDVRTSPSTTATSLDSRLIVAGGGGGGGGDAFNCTPGDGILKGGDGGDAGAPGAGGELCPIIGPSRNDGGGAGTATAGGTAGVAGDSPDEMSTGAAGGWGSGAESGNVGGGGGGGGLWGGGSGADSYTNVNMEDAVAAGGGGGGSSLVPAGGTLGLSDGPAAVTISYGTGVSEPPVATPTTVRGGGVLAAGGQRYTVAVAASVTGSGRVTGSFGLAGGGADTTAGSRTITKVTRTATGATVAGTAVTAAGRTVSFLLTVVDKPGGKDQITLSLGPRTVSGNLATGDISTR